MGFKWFFDCKRKSLKWNAYNLVGNQRSIENYLQDDLDGNDARILATTTAWDPGC